MRDRSENKLSTCADDTRPQPQLDVARLLVMYRTPDAQETTDASSAKTRRTLLFPEGNIYRYILSIQPIHKKARLDVGSSHRVLAVLSRQNPHQAKMIRMVLEMAGSIDVCSICGDSRRRKITATPVVIVAA